MPFSVREGINIFLAGFIPTENMRFREDSLSFKVATGVEEEAAKPTSRYLYPAMSKKLIGKPGAPPFQLHVRPGEFSDSQVCCNEGAASTARACCLHPVMPSCSMLIAVNPFPGCLPAHPSPASPLPSSLPLPRPACLAACLLGITCRSS